MNPIYWPYPPRMAIDICTDQSHSTSFLPAAGHNVTSAPNTPGGMAPCVEFCLFSEILFNVFASFSFIKFIVKIMYRRLIWLLRHV